MENIEGLVAVLDYMTNTQRKKTYSRRYIAKCISSVWRAGIYSHDYENRGGN